MNRVVVTGMGLVTPFGCGGEHNWNKLISGNPSAKKITKFDVKDYKCQVACEVPHGNGDNGTFNAEEWIEKKELKKIDDLGADSLDTVELVMAFEEAFDVEIPDEKAATILTVGDAISHLETD